MHAHVDAAGLAKWNGTPTVFPVGRWDSGAPQSIIYAPTRSQEYRPSNHHGVDIMYRRKASGGPDARFAVGTTEGIANWFMPAGQLCYAAKDGYIWSSGTGPTGRIVVIDHGAPFASCYIHMESLLIPDGISRGAGRVPIRAGQPIGVIGYDPSDARKLRHLHFEIWFNGNGTAHVDPWPLINTAPLPAQ